MSRAGPCRPPRASRRNHRPQRLPSLRAPCPTHFHLHRPGDANPMGHPRRRRVERRRHLRRWNSMDTPARWPGTKVLCPPSPASSGARPARLVGKLHPNAATMNTVGGHSRSLAFACRLSVKSSSPGRPGEYCNLLVSPLRLLPRWIRQRPGGCLVLRRGRHPSISCTLKLFRAPSRADQRARTHHDGKFKAPQP
jgi:hypothetical protein